jgi:hypothetical protein
VVTELWLISGGHRSLPMKLVFILSKRWEILRVTEHVTRKMLADPYCNVRILPNDVQEMVACVKKPPLVPFSPLTAHTHTRHAHARGHIHTTNSHHVCPYMLQIHIIDASMYIVEAMAPECNVSEAIRLLETALYVVNPEVKHSLIVVVELMRLVYLCRVSCRVVRTQRAPHHRRRCDAVGLLHHVGHRARRGRDRPAPPIQYTPPCLS